MIIIRGIVAVFVHREKRNLSFDSRLGMFLQCELNQNSPLCLSYIFLFSLSFKESLSLSPSIFFQEGPVPAKSADKSQISDSFPSLHEASSASVGNCSASD